MYEDWTKEDLIWKIRELKNKIEDLEGEVRQKDSEIDHLNFVIETELEPRKRAEAHAYDLFISTPRNMP